MTRILPCAAIAAIIGLIAACSSSSSSEIALTNAGFEDTVQRAGWVPGWILTQHAGPISYETIVDDQVHVEGRASFRIKRLRDQVYGRIAQRVPIKDLAGKTVEISAMLKTEDVGSKGWLIQLTQTGQITDRVSTESLSGTREFTQVSAKMKIAEGATELEIAGMLRDSGTAWLDDVHLRIVEP